MTILIIYQYFFSLHIIEFLGNHNSIFWKFLLFRELLQLFTTPELINWRLLHQKYESDLREATSDITAAEVFGHDEIGKKCWQDLKNRVVEHVSSICKLSMLLGCNF